MKIQTFAISCIFLIGLSGCDYDDKLSRERAADLIEALAINAGSRIQIDKETANCLVESNQATNRACTNWQVHDMGKLHLKEIEWGCFGGGGYLSLLSPIKFSNVIVTGLLENSQELNQTVIEFEGEYDFSSIMSERYKPRCFKSLRVSGVAVANKYDDGWRVRFNTLPTYALADFAEDEAGL